MSKLIDGIYNRYNRMRQLKYCPIQQRHDDLYLVAFPKSGVTWLSSLIAHLGLRLGNDYRAINVFNVQDFVPDIHVSRHAPLNPTMPGFGFRIFKSHSLYNSHYKKVIHLVRDPRDVMISYYHFLTTLNLYRGSLSDLIRDPSYGIHSWVKHTNGWLNGVDPTTLINYIRYEDLKRNPQAVLRHLLLIFGFGERGELIDDATESLSFKNMQASEKVYAKYNLTIPSEHAFMRKGNSGGWKDEISSADINFINEISFDLVSRFGYTA